MIPAIGPAPRLEPLVDEGLETGKEEDVADDCPLVDERLETGKEEEVADKYDTDGASFEVVLVAWGSLDVTRDAEMDV